MKCPMVLPFEPAAALAEEAPPLAFESVYSGHFRGVWRTLRRLGVADTQLDDAAQDVFIVVHRKLESFDGRSLRGWLYAIAVRVASDYRRGVAHRRAAQLPEGVRDPALDPQARSELQESVRLLHALLEELPSDLRTVFVLAELEELTVPEIAEALGANLNTVYSQKRSARLRFEAALKRERARLGGGAP
jgi:RNA polymerase sigma-70 factor (ECF subfamily)